MKKLLVQGLLVVFLSLFLYSCSEENQPPTLVILATPASGNAPLSVQCRADASDPDNNLLAFGWDFGDGSLKSSEQNPTHIFIDAGVFTATCTVTDNGSPRKSTSKTTTITVYALTPTLSSLKPAWKVAHLPEFTLMVTGNNFVPSSKIVFNGVEKTVEYVSASEIRCRITPEETDVFSANTLSSTENSIKAISESTLGVWVRNPSPGGDSQPLNFTVKSSHTFSSPQLVCSDADGDYKLLIGRYLYLVYSRGSSNNRKIMVSKDDGKTWSGGYEVPYSQNDSAFSLTADNRGILYLANFAGDGNDTDVMLTSSGDNGASWTANRLISAGMPDGGSCSYTSQNLNITASNDDSLHVVWMEHGVECGGSSNYYIRSTDHGENWSERIKTPDAGTTNVYYPMFIGKGYGYNTLHYISYIGGSYESPEGPYYQYSKNKGLTWSSPVLINPEKTFYSNKIPAAGLNDYLYFSYIWVFHYFWSIAAQVSVDHGQSWYVMKYFFSDYGGTLFESLTFLSDTAGNLNVIWLSFEPVAGIDYFIYYRRITSLANLDSAWDPSPATAAATGYKFLTDSCTVDEEGNLYIICQDKRQLNLLYIVRSERDE